MGSISIAILSGHQNQVEEDAAIPPHGHTYRPVSILQRLPQQGEGIHLQTLTSSNILPQPPQRQVRILKNGPISKQDVNGTNNLGSTDRHRRYEERRRQCDRQRPNSGSSRTQGRNDPSTAESSRVDAKKRTTAQQEFPSGGQELPPSGLIRSVSGSLKQYL